MTKIRQLSRTVNTAKLIKANWYPGHMYSGMQAMMGKLNTVDCIVEVHDARIPFTGRNPELKRQLAIKPRLLVLNKTDLADLSKWDDIKNRLSKEGDPHVILTDLTGSEFSFSKRGYDTLIERVMQLINQSDRYNRQMMKFFKIMVVGIPNVGKSTLINRLRQYYVGKKGEALRTGSEAGVTKHIENLVRVCTRPMIYSFDTPGVLEAGFTKGYDKTMRLALCSNINDKVLDPTELAQYLLNYLNQNQNYTYAEQLGLEAPAESLEKVIAAIMNHQDRIMTVRDRGNIDSNTYQATWHFIRKFRQGYYGKVMFD